jgi:type I restriction enzyme S subunit
VSNIDELIQELCPDGVSNLELGEVVRIRNGRDYQHLQEGNIPVYGSGGVMKYVNESFYQEPSVLIPRKGSLGNLFFVDLPFWTVDTIFYTEVGDTLEPKYLFYFLKTQDLASMNLAGGVPSLTQTMLNKVMIPVPPLTVQREIVEILDKFTQLEAELEAELEARESQLTYFLDRVFDLEGSHNAPSESLKSACRITRASGLEKSHLQEEGLPVVQYGEIHMHYDTVATSSRSFADPLIAGKLHKANPGDVILVTTSEDVKDVGNPLVWLGPTPIGVGGESVIIEHDLDPVYLGMFFKSNSFYSQKLPYVNGSKVKRISTSNLQKILIPVPERGVQKMLGENLLALENLVKSASVGLPAEIAARRKQYEYYRDKLLAFKELDVA